MSAIDLVLRVHVPTTFPAPVLCRFHEHLGRLAWKEKASQRWANGIALAVLQ